MIVREVLAAIKMQGGVARAVVQMKIARGIIPAKNKNVFQRRNVVVPNIVQTALFAVEVVDA